MGCVYFARRLQENVFKIGSAACLTDRMKKHSTTDPWLKPHGVIETDEYSLCETFLHNYYEIRRVDGTKEFFRFLPEELCDVVKVAELFLSRNLPTKRAADRFCHQQNESRVVAPSDRERDIYRELREIRQQQYRLEKQRELLESELKIVIGTASSLEGVASWKSHVKPHFDRTQLKVDNPAIFAKYTREQIERRFDLY